MIGLELACVAILLVYGVVSWRTVEDRKRFVSEYATIWAAAWIAEDTCIRLYGFYGYAPEWSVFLDQTPLLITLIWPTVILSARDLARALGAPSTRVPLAGAALVLADAALIEPIAVSAGLWTWTEPGLFGVPVIGILGWSLFAWAALNLLERNTFLPQAGASTARASATRRLLVCLVGAPVATHVLLLTTWWGCFRWIPREVPPIPAIVFVGGLSLALTGAAVQRRLRQRLTWKVYGPRIPAALFFFALLSLHGGESPLLVAWALAFVPPYMTLAPSLHTGPSGRDAVSS
jgi:hypothetical protein